MRTDALYQQYNKQRIVVGGQLIGEVYFYNEKAEERHAAINYTRNRAKREPHVQRQMDQR